MCHFPFFVYEVLFSFKKPYIYQLTGKHRQLRQSLKRLSWFSFGVRFLENIGQFSEFAQVEMVELRDPINKQSDHDVWSTSHT